MSPQVTFKSNEDRAPGAEVDSGVARFHRAEIV
jgi:hypothetical protein